MYAVNLNTGVFQFYAITHSVIQSFPLDSKVRLDSKFRGDKLLIFFLTI